MKMVLLLVKQFLFHKYRSGECYGGYDAKNKIFFSFSENFAAKIRKIHIFTELPKFTFHLSLMVVETR